MISTLDHSRPSMTRSITPLTEPVTASDGTSSLVLDFGCESTNTYAYDWFFALAACLGVFLHVAIRAHWVSFAFIECNGCDWFLTHEAHEMFGMPRFTQSGQSLWMHENKKLLFNDKIDKNRYYSLDCLCVCVRPREWYHRFAFALPLFSLHCMQCWIQIARAQLRGQCYQFN